MGGKRWSSEEERDLGEYYPKATKEYILSQLPNRSWDGVILHARKLEINREVHVNEHFFDSWNTDMAYILGLWFADGHMRIQCGGHYISFASIDREHLENIKNIMEITNKTGVVNRNHNNNSHTCYYFSIGNKHIYKRILELGGVPNKSLKMLLPDNLPNNYFFDFLRGYFDGDGYVVLGYNNYLSLKLTSGSREFLKLLSSKIEELSHVKTVEIAPDGRENNHSYYLYYHGWNAVRVSKKMYEKKNSLSLERKKVNVERGINRKIGHIIDGKHQIQDCNNLTKEYIDEDIYRIFNNVCREERIHNPLKRHVPHQKRYQR